MTVIEFPVGEASTLRLTQKVGRYRFDPLGFVMFAFPWGKPGTALAVRQVPNRGSARCWRSLGAA